MRWIPSSFRNRLAMLFGGLALVVGLPVYLYIDHVYAAQMVADRGRVMHDLAGAVAAAFAENLSERQREIDLLAQTPLYQRESFDSQDFTTSVELLQKSYPHYSWIGVADTQGVVKASTGSLLLGQSVSQRPWFIAGQKRSFTGDLHEALLLSKLLPPQGRGPVRFIDFAAPIRDEQGNLRGVLAAHAYWRWAGEVVRVMVPQSAAEQGLDIFIVNGAKQIVYPEGDTESLQVPDAAFGDSSFVLTSWGDAATYVTARAKVRELAPEQPLNWSIVVRQPTLQTLADVRDLQRLMIVFALGSAVIFLALAWWSASLVSRPIERLAKLARRIEQGDNHASFKVRSSTLEVRLLVDALRSMASSLLSREEALTESNLRLEHKVAERTAELAQANIELLQQARHDALTGLANRHAASERLREEFLRMQRSKTPYAVLMMDVDYFKRVNDTHGHAVGDEVLQHVATVLRGSIRASDFVARFGGEEFIALLPETALHEAGQVAEKIRRSLESQALPTVGHITLSIGLAMADMAQVDADVAVREADAYLYKAKHAGRNRVASANDEADLRA